MSSVLRIVGSDRSIAELRSAPASDEYFNRLLKLIPSEVTAAYVCGTGIIPAQAIVGSIVWALFCLVLTVLIRRQLTLSGPGGPPQWKAVAISGVSFLLWVYMLDGPFQRMGIREPYIGSLAMIGWTTLVPLVYTGDPPPTVKQL